MYESGEKRSDQNQRRGASYPTMSENQPELSIAERKRTERLLKEDAVEKLIRHQVARYDPNKNLYRPSVENYHASVRALRKITSAHRPGYVTIREMHVGKDYIPSSTTLDINADNLDTVETLLKKIENASPLAGTEFLQTAEGRLG